MLLESQDPADQVIFNCEARANCLIPIDLQVSRFRESQTSPAGNVSISGNGFAILVSL